VHRSAAVSVPVVARRTGFEGARILRATEATELDVALSRVDGEEQTWLYAGNGPAMAIEVSAESGRALARAITSVLSKAVLSKAVLSQAVLSQAVLAEEEPP